MVSDAQIGELIVGAYHKLVTDAEVVSYNQRSKAKGEQMEIDVLAIDSRNGKQTVYVSEVITHLDGSGYSGSPKDKERWTEFGNTSYQRTLEKLWHKFLSGHNYVTRVFNDADEYVFQLWAPYISEGHLTNGFEQLSDDFESERGERIEFVINETYTERINELRSLAAEESKDYGAPAFRFLQIIEQMR